MTTGAGLGYLFWHAPTDGSDGAGYEAAMAHWHEALAAHPSPGWSAGWTWHLPTPPWLAGWPASVYLDVYVVTDFASLGWLNAAAPTGRLQPAHDDAARRAGYGSGALFALRAGRPAPHPGPGATTDVELHWYDKAAGAPYPDTLRSLAGPGRSVWLRQMVLGAGPELLVVADPGTPSPAPGPDDGPASPVWQARAAWIAGSRRAE